MKSTVIFDLDGLLIDSEVISYRVCCDLIESYGHQFSLEEYIHGYSGKTGPANMRSMMDTYHLPISMEEGLAFVERREREYLRGGVALKPGARELLSYLKRQQYKIMLATSSSKGRAVEILVQNGVGAYFDGMVFGADVERGKPFPDIFLKAAELAGEPPEQCLVLEDSEAGVQAASSAGIEVLCIPDMKAPGEPFRELAAAELGSLEEVIPWLEAR